MYHTANKNQQKFSNIQELAHEVQDNLCSNIVGLRGKTKRQIEWTIQKPDIDESFKQDFENAFSQKFCKGERPQETVSYNGRSFDYVPADWKSNPVVKVLNTIISIDNRCPTIYCSHAYICNKTGLARWKVVKIVTALAKFGLLKKQFRSCGHDFKTDLYGIADYFKLWDNRQALKHIFASLAYFCITMLLTPIRASDRTTENCANTRFDSRVISNSYNYNIIQRGDEKIDEITKNSKEELEEHKEALQNSEEQSFSLSTSFEEYARRAIRNLSLSKPPVALPPHSSQSELLRKRSKAFIDAEKETQRKRSPKNRFPFLCEEGIYFAVSTGMSPWEAALLVSIPAQDMVSILVKFSAILFKSKIGSFQASHYLRKEEKTKVIYRDVFHSTKKLAWWFVHSEIEKLGLKLDYQLATMVRNYYGLREGEAISMYDQSIFMKSLSSISNKLDTFRKLSEDEYAKAAKKVKSEEQKDKGDREKIRAQHRETIQYQEFKEDGIEEDRYKEDGVYDEDENFEGLSLVAKSSANLSHTNKQSIVGNNSPAPRGLSSEEQFKHDLKNYREALSKITPFMYDMMKANFTQILIRDYNLPTDFDILTYQI